MTVIMLDKKHGFVITWRRNICWHTPPFSHLICVHHKSYVYYNGFASTEQITDFYCVRLITEHL